MPPPESAPDAAPAPTGTPDAPAFTPRRSLLVVALVAYALFVGAMIVWSVQLRR